MRNLIILVIGNIFLFPALGKAYFTETGSVWNDGKKSNMIVLHTEVEISCEVSYCIYTYGLGVHLIKIPGDSILTEAIPPPWDSIALVGEFMKPGFSTFNKRGFPWIPVATGTIVSGAAISYFLLRDDQVVDCTFETSFVTTNAHCGQADGSASVNVSPVDDYSFIWSNGENTATLENLAAGDYSVTVSNSKGCAKEFSVSIEEVPADFDASFSTTEAHCGQADGSAIVNVSPVDDYSFIWSNGENTAILENLAAGDYTVTVSNSKGCAKEFSVSIEEVPADFDASFSTTEAHCGQADGSASVDVSPVNDYSFVWSNGENTATLENLAAGDYTVTVSNSMGCAKEFSVSIEEVPADFDASFSTTEAHCGQADGSASVDVSPEDDYSFVWSNGESTATLENLAAGDYSVTVSNSMGCAKEFSISIEEVPADFDASFSTTEAHCGQADGSVSVDVSPEDDYSFVWSNGESTATLENLAAGDYSVTISNSMGCTKEFLVSIAEVSTEFEVEISTVNANCGLADGSATIQVLSSSSDFTFLWEDGTTGPTNNNLPSGASYVTVEDIESGCMNTFEVIVEEDPPNYIQDLNVIHPTCNEAGEISFLGFSPTNGPLFLSIIHPNGNLDMIVEPGMIFLSQHVPIVEGSYSISVVDLNIGADCEDHFEVTIYSQSEAPAIVVENIVHPSSYTENNGAITLVIVDQTMPVYTVYLNGEVWGTTSSEVFTIGELSVGKYSIYIEDFNGCVSNKIEVELVVSGSIPMLGYAFIPFKFESHSIESPNFSYNRMVTAIKTSFPYLIKNRVFTADLYFTTIEHHNLDFQQDLYILQVESSTPFLQWGNTNINFRMDAGIGTSFALASDMRINSEINKFVFINGLGSIQVTRFVKIDLEFRLPAWERFEYPQFRFSILSAL